LSRIVGGGRYARPDDLLPEQVLVADVDRDPLAGEFHWRLVRATPLLVADRHLHAVDEPAEAERNELAERNQVTLAVPVPFRTAGRNAHRAVEVVLRRLFDEDAKDHRGAPGIGELAQCVDVARRNELQRHREHGLRQRDQVDPRALHQRPMRIERAHEPFGPELRVLRDVGLHQPHADRRSGRLRPRDGAQQQTSSERDADHGCGPDIAAPATLREGQREQRQRSGQDCRNERDAVDAASGANPASGPSVCQPLRQKSVKRPAAT
jgi:hypothetical protein